MTDDPAALAYRLADTARRLNAATEKPSSYAEPAAVRDVAEGLELAVAQLPATIRQLAAGLRHLEEAGAVRPDGAAGDVQLVSAALRALLNAEVGVALARAALREAAAPLAGLGVGISAEGRR